VLDGLNLLDGKWYAENPHQVWAEMRQSSPVHWDPVAQVWGVARYRDVMAVERDPKSFSSYRAPRPHGQHLPMMISMDDPEHQRRRSLVNRGFTPKRVNAHEPMLRALCRTILNKVAEKGSCDFVWDVAAPLPLLVIAELLGYDHSWHDDLLRWSEELMLPSEPDLTPAMIQQRIEAGSRTIMEFREAQLGIIADRRRNPRDDVITTLCEAEIDGERLDDESIVQETLLILIGGDETTRHVISGGMLALLENRDQLTALRSGDADLVVAVEEMIRWTSPVQNMGRTATRDTVVRGRKIEEGQQLMLFYPSANRDEDEFADGQTFDIRRQPNPHVAFGFGTHFCLGASLARLECRLMFTELLRRLPDIELATGDPLPRRASNFVSGLEAMPVIFTPVPAPPSDGPEPPRT
jgi:cytochrome P450 family 142 subfamily A polypeptide 1